MSQTVLSAVSRPETKERVSDKLSEDHIDLEWVEDYEELLSSLRNGEGRVLMLESDFLNGNSPPRFIEDIRSTREDIEVILILGDDRVELAKSALKNGAYGVCIASEEAEILPAKVEGALESVQERQAERVYSRALEERVNQRTEQLWEKVKSLREQFVNIVHALCKALYAKHPYTEGHSWRVAKVSERIARAMGIVGKDLENIRLGALFHDIGKIGVRDDLLSKPGELTEAEYQEVKQHTQVASEILSPMKEFSGVVDIIKYEHENFDGSGYPHGMAGKEIPVGARIVRVADTYDAIVSRRSYQEHSSHREAMKEIQHVSGSECCPDVVKYFRALFPEDEGGLPREERIHLLGDRFEQVHYYSEYGEKKDNDFLSSLRDDQNQDVIVIGEE